MALTFSFGGSSGQSYDELKRRRAFAEAMQLRGAQGQPKSAIEGINSAAQSILGALMSKKLGQQEDASRQAYQGQMANTLGGLFTQDVAGSGSYSPVAAPADPNSPRGIGDAAMAALGKPSNGFGDEAQAFKTNLLAGGLPPHVVDGIMMNAKDESGLNPEAVGDNGAAYGLLQWNGPRKAALEQFAASVGGNPADPAIQAQFTLHELKGPESAAYKSLMATGNAGDAGAVFVNEYERPAEAHRSRREAEYRGGMAGPEIAIPQIMTLMNDGRASEADKSVLGMLLQQKLAQMQPADPMDALALEKAQLEIEQMRNGTNGATEYGLQPIVTQDDKGNYHLFQIPKDGSDPKEVKLPYGWTPKQQYLDTGTGFQAMPTQGTAADDPVIVPKDVSGKAAATAVGEASGAAQVALPGAAQAAADVAAQVEALKTDPYLPNMLGPVGSRLPNVSTDAARVQGKMGQLQGGAFLQARQLLKGGGAITDYEGQKAEAAFARLSAAQSPEDYKAALDEFNYYVQQGVKKLNDQAGMTSPPAVSAQPPSSGTAQFRFNPTTGKIEPVQ